MAAPATGSSDELRLAAKPVVTGLFVASFFIAIFLTAFHRPEPHGMPVRVAGPPAEVARVRTVLDRALPGALDLQDAADADSARQAIEDRHVYGAIVLGRPGATVPFAGANGPVAAAFFRVRLTAVLARAGVRARPVDVVPLPARDTSGLSLFYLAFGSVLGSFIFSVVAMAATERALGVRTHVLATVAFAVRLAVVVPALAAGIGAIPGGDVPGVAAIVLLLAGGTSLAAVFLLKVSRALGTLVPSLLLLTLGNASGGAVPPAFLPAWLGWLSPVLPGGIALSGLRGLVYFDGAGLARALVVLVAWVVLAAGGLVWLDRRGRPAAPGAAPA